MTSPKEIPLLGLGTWLADDEDELDKAVDKALELGYRHFDTAWIYMNEKIVGRVIKRWIDAGRITREELYIVTKLPVCAMRPEKVSHFLQQSLQNLDLSYVDLYLMHVPFGIDSLSENDPIPIRNGKVVMDPVSRLEAVWTAMEETVRRGKATNIGLSNCEASQIERIVKISKIPPYVLQVEAHVYFQQMALRATCARNGIRFCAYSPLGSPGRGDFYGKVGLDFKSPGLLEDPVVLRVAKKAGKTAGQVCLQFLVQQGIIAIPKSTNAGRLKENFEVLNFKLGAEDMTELEGLDKGLAGRSLNFNFLPGIEEHPEFPKDMRNQ